MNGERSRAGRAGEPSGVRPKVRRSAASFERTGLDAILEMRANVLCAAAGRELPRIAIATTMCRSCILAHGLAFGMRACRAQPHYHNQYFTPASRARLYQMLVPNALQDLPKLHSSSQHAYLQPCSPKAVLTESRPRRSRGAWRS
jgi:hypothetical protein